MKLIHTLILVVPYLLIPTAASTNDIGPQSQYEYETTSTTTPTFAWNVTIANFMSIDKPATEQGVYNLRSTYLLDDRSYDVELFKVDCLTPPTPTFPLVFSEATETPVPPSALSTELQWTYNQTKIEDSDLWTANKTGGYVEFCIRVNNYLPEDGELFAREIDFLEVQYRIEVNSVTEFNTTIDIERIESTDGGTEVIDYEEDIDVFQCEDDYSPIDSPPALTQGEYMQICVKTVDGSAFGVHSIKELDVSQDDTNLYPYVDGYIDSPLALTECKDDAKNSTDAVCKAKMQLLAAYFDDDTPSDLFVNGTIRLDYVGRRLTMDVPLSLRFDNPKNEANAGRILAAEDDTSAFGLNVKLASSEDIASTASGVSVFSIGSLFSTVIMALMVGEILA